GGHRLREAACRAPPVPVGVLEGVQQLVLGLAVQPGALASVAAGGFQGGAALLLGVDRPLDACHVCRPLRRRRRTRGTAGGGVLQVVSGPLGARWTKSRSRPTVLTRSRR